MRRSLLTYGIKKNFASKLNKKLIKYKWNERHERRNVILSLAPRLATSASLSGVYEYVLDSLMTLIDTKLIWASFDPKSGGLGSARRRAENGHGRDGRGDWAGPPPKRLQWSLRQCYRRSLATQRAAHDSREAICKWDTLQDFKGQRHCDFSFHFLCCN